MNVDCHLRICIKCYYIFCKIICSRVFISIYTWFIFELCIMRSDLQNAVVRNIPGNNRHFGTIQFDLRLNLNFNCRSRNINNMMLKKFWYKGLKTGQVLSVKKNKNRIHIINVARMMQDIFHKVRWLRICYNAANKFFTLLLHSQILWHYSMHCYVEHKKCDNLLKFTCYV